MEALMEPPAGGKVADVVYTLRILADPTRLEILWWLGRGEMNVTELCDRLGLQQPAVSYHLTILLLRRLVEFDRRGKNNFYSLTDQGRLALDAAMTMIAAP